MSDLDDYLLHRTEQAVLGALLAGADPARAGMLHANEFADPLHRAIYAAFTQPAGSWADRLRDWIARITSRRVNDAVDYINELPSRCPNAAHLAMYAAMLRGARPGQQAPAVQPPAQTPRQEPSPAAGAGQQLEGASQWLSATAGRQASRRTRDPRQQAGAGPGEALDPATERLSRAIRAAMRSGRFPRGGRSPFPEPGPPVDSSARAGDRGTSPSLSREDLQDAVLADLMRHPADGRSLVQRVPLNVFSRGARQELYRLIAQPIAEGKAVDWLITAWQARKQEESCQGAPAAAEGAAPESLAAIAVRLGAMRPRPGTAGVLGRALLGEYEVSTAFGSQWTQQRDLNWAAAGPVADDHHMTDEPSATQEPVSREALQPQPVSAGSQKLIGRHRAAQPGPRAGPVADQAQVPNPRPQTPPPPPDAGRWQQGHVQQR